MRIKKNDYRPSTFLLAGVNMIKIISGIDRCHKKPLHMSINLLVVEHQLNKVIMKKTIIVATDFSPAANNAVDYAAEMAFSIFADLIVLHVYEVPVMYAELPPVTTESKLLSVAEYKLDELMEQLIAKTKGRINIITELRVGGFQEQLENICDILSPYLVIMGSQGKTATERLFYGDNSVKAIKNLTWPIITVPRGISYASIKRIGLACDLDDVASTIPIEEIRMLVKDLNADLHVINIRKVELFKPETIYESGMLQEMLMDLDPTYHFIINDNVDEALIEFAEKHRIHLLIVLPKRRGIIDTLIRKSHTKEFVLHSCVPVLAIHE